jgi:hypothetical protein
MWDHNKLPRQFEIPGEKRLLHQMFWESRMRYYRGRPLRRILEAGRHAGFTAVHDVYSMLVRTRTILRKRQEQGS